MEGLICLAVASLLYFNFSLSYVLFLWIKKPNSLILEEEGRVEEEKERREEGGEREEGEDDGGEGGGEG